MTNYIYWDIDPIIVKLASIEIRYYSLLFVSGLLGSFYILKYFFKREKIDIELLDKLFIFTGFGIILGARIGHCLFYEWAYFKDHLLEIVLPFQNLNGSFQFTGFRGLASHGAGIGIISSVALYAYLYKQNILSILDKVAIITPFAGAFIRFGNLMNSEIIGHPTDLPWAFIFKQVDDIPRHPAQLYEALAYLLIFAIIFFSYTRYQNLFKPGFTAGLFLTLTFTARFFIEFIKENQEAFEKSMTINMGQWLSIPFVLIGIVLIIYSVPKKRF